ncbi:hypothetical protein C8Q79DRAFT_991926 [Trametes meyenii]|nr:hypothetical protein C8Q79DRAFT_991926 [Trametes meyenii]
MLSRSPSCPSAAALVSSAPSGGPSPVDCHLHIHRRYKTRSAVNRGSPIDEYRSKHTSHLARAAKCRGGRGLRCSWDLPSSPRSHSRNVHARACHM